MLVQALAFSAAVHCSIDKATLRKLASEALAGIRDVQLGYEGSYRTLQNNNPIPFAGIYSRNGIDQTSISFRNEVAGKNGAVEESWTHTHAQGEYWTLHKRDDALGGTVSISKALGPGGVVNRKCYERVFLLPALLGYLNSKWSTVQTLKSGADGQEQIIVDVSGDGRTTLALTVDLTKQCAVLDARWAVNGKVFLAIKNVVLRKFASGRDIVWLPVSAVVEEYTDPRVAVGQVKFLEIPYGVETYAMTNGAFKSPAGLQNSFFQPPLGSEYTVLDSVGNRGHAASSKFVSANEREAVIAKEMDRLEAEGKLGKFAARPGFDWWRIVPLLLGGVLLGAAGVVLWRRRKA